MTAISATPLKVPALKPPVLAKLSLVKSILITLSMMLLSAMLLTQGQIPDDPLLAAAVGVTWLGFNSAFFLMLWTGRTDRYRAVLFTLIAFSMIITFAALIQSERGSNQLTMEDVINGRTPFCPLVIPSIILPAVFTKTIIFPGSLLSGFAGIAFMVILWLGSSIVLGRGYCSWMCFYGGYDDGISRLAKKARIRKIDRRWIFFPFALLLVVVLVSAMTLDPAYCTWLCPFKAVTEYAAVTDIITLIQTIIFVLLFIGLVVVLPFLTKRRTQCGLFCPFGAFQSFTNHANVFDVRIDPQKCSGCQKCVNSCPTYSLDENSLKTGRTLMTCTKCGKCVDACPKNAISYHIKGTASGVRPALARALFIYPAFLLMIAFNGGTVAMALYQVMKTIGQWVG